MKDILFSFLLLILSIQYGFSQFTFEKTYKNFAVTFNNSSPLLYGKQIFALKDGYFIQSTNNANYRDLLFLRTDINGDTLWTKVFGADTIQYFTYDMISMGDNPTSGKLFIENLKSDDQICIYSIEGQLIHAYTNLSSGSIDLSSNSKGIYLIKIKSKTGDSYQKIILK